MRQWNKETIEEQLKLHKKQNKDERYNYFASEFNSLWYCWELEKYTINKQQQIAQLTNNWNELEEWLQNEIERFKEIAVNQGLFIDKELSIRLNARIKLIETILDKMKEIKDGNNV